ncbi:MAG: NAD(P)/FAD-dependent oxidoreductase [Granulosicoccus sp.]
MDQTIADVLIIGGGMAGVGCAAMLPNDVTVVLLEAEPHCGYHATGRSAAAWIAGYGGPEIRVLTLQSKAYLSNPPTALGEAGFLSPRGEMLLARSDVEERELDTLLCATPDLTEISTQAAIGHVPVLRKEGLRRAAFAEEAFDIDADRLLQAWLRTLAQRPNAQVSTTQSVTAISRFEGHWKITTANEQTWLARKVVNAAGAWADPLAALVGLAPLGLIPHRRSAALLPPPAGHDVNAWPLIVSADESWYARPLGGKLMVSPADETPTTAHDAFAEELTIAEGLDRFEQAVTTDVTRVETTWAGLRTFAPDRVPVVGEDPEADGFFWLAGQGGYGIQTAPALCALAARLLSKQPLNAWQQELVPHLAPARLISG